MSEKGLNYSLTESLGNNNDLLVFYNFSGLSGRHIGIDNRAGTKYSVIENCEPANDTGIYSGIVVGLGSTTNAGAKQLTTGTFLINDKADLSESNLQITGTETVPYSNCSVIMDFEFNGEVNDCVLFGSLEKGSTTINDQVITGAKGFNFGITDRGKLFYQGFGKDGDFIYTSSDLELSKRNIISFSLGFNQVTMCKYDFFNQQIDKDDFNVDTSYIANNEDFYIGGSNQYFRGTNGEFKTSNVSLNSFALLSGYISPNTIFGLGSGMIGNYFTSSEAATTETRITGYHQTTVYETGITGYDYEDTGSLNLSTGRGMLTGNFSYDSNTNTGEGDRYFVYRFFDVNQVTGFVKEEVGFLHPDSGYQYLPTGDTSAFDTLGLQDVEGAVAEYIEQRGISGAATISVQLFGSRIQTGVLDKISGVIQEPMYETVIDTPKSNNSGIRMDVSGEYLKKDYIYYLGDRI